ncbi:putative mucin [Aspergillus stella-maris]|uniref:putative mucin n=1 Tax=Aspergillus stella-maris TaxID=1810926 RepID=UPI003CCE500C
MSLPVPSTHPYLSAPPYTPNFPHDSRTAGTTKQPLQNTLDLLELPWTAPFRDGLPTPPNDMNGVAYSSITPYGGKSEGYAVPVYNNNKLPSYPRMSADFLSRMTQQPQSQSQPSSTVAPTTVESGNQPKEKDSSRPLYLQIPSSINGGKGNLPDFAAQMTCLFWFENTPKLRAIEDRSSQGASLSPDAIPSVGFQKWLSSILSTTQVSQNVILLALLFIYRLKKFNPAVRGKKGSEYRLMTVALMLGNKFLDDNTYTNKTWADVSRISVQEIHVMEVEFLSNLRYNLYASEKEWAQWHVKLGLFADFFNNAPLASDNIPTPPVHRLSPNVGPALTQLSPTSTTRLPSPSAELLHPQTWAPVNASSYPAIPQVASEMPPISSRKRRYEEPTEEQQPAKKMSLTNAMPLPSSSLPPAAQMTAPALPPMLAPTSAPPQQSVPASAPRLPPSTFMPSVPSSIPQLPAAPARPTMTRVYNSNASWAPQVPATTAPGIPSGAMNPNLALPDPSRNHSPYPASSTAISPAVSAYAVHTPNTHLSPSYFLANRNSPYRPVRSVNTLLIPPPSASLEQQRSIPFDHMHYQPLGKSTAERRTGLLPYLHHDAFPQGPYIPPSFHSTPHYA